MWREPIHHCHHSISSLTAHVKGIKKSTEPLAKNMESYLLVHAFGILSCVLNLKAYGCLSPTPSRFFSYFRLCMDRHKYRVNYLHPLLDNDTEMISKAVVGNKQPQALRFDNIANTANLL